jgi:hypothetical protein
MKHKTYWVCIILFCIALGFFQEFLKVNVNFTIDEGSKIPGFWNMSFEQREQALYQASRHNPFDYYHSHTRIPILNHLGLVSLKSLKWVITVFFVVVFYGVNRSMISRLVEDKRGGKWLKITYLVSFSFAFLVYLVGLPTQSADLFYNVSRKMVGALQSPIPAMMNWAAWRLNKQQEQHNDGTV